MIAILDKLEGKDCGICLRSSDRLFGGLLVRHSAEHFWIIRERYSVANAAGGPFELKEGFADYIFYEGDVLYVQVQRTDEAALAQREIEMLEYERLRTDV